MTCTVKRVTRRKLVCLFIRCIVQHCIHMKRQRSNTFNIDTLYIQDLYNTRMRKYASILAKNQIDNYSFFLLPFSFHFLDAVLWLRHIGEWLDLPGRLPQRTCVADLFVCGDYKTPAPRLGNGAKASMAITKEQNHARIRTSSSSVTSSRAWISV